MRYIALLILVLLALLQATIAPRVPFLGVRPELALVGVMAWVMVRGLHEGAIGACVGGMTLDLLSGRPLGSHVLAMLLAVVPIGLLGAPFYQGNMGFPVLGGFVGTLLYNLILLALTRLLGESVVWGGTLWRIVLPLGLVHATLMPLVYWIVSWMDRRLRRRIRIG